MFDLPETKRVRRTDIFSPPQSRPPTPPRTLTLDLDFITVTPPAPTPSPPTEHDFPLFSTATRHKITLKDPTPPPSAEDAWERLAQTQKRPETYYVLSEADMAARRQQFAEVVVSAEDVVRGAGMAWPGCRVPWKVTRITVASGVVGGGGGRKRPGKKRRVWLRVEEQKRRAVEEARMKSIEGRKKFAGLPKEEREAREREEKNRRNREKKVKRRVREKAKKEAARAAGEEGSAEKEAGSGSEVEIGA